MFKSNSDDGSIIKGKGEGVLEQNNVDNVPRG